MNADDFHDWLKDHEACEDALQWLDTLPDPTLPAAWEACPRGDWLLWLSEAAGAEFKTLAPVVYRAVTRALGHAALALDNAGVGHKLEDVVVEDCASAQVAEDAARAAAGAARAAEATRAAEAAEQVVVAAGWAAGVIGSAAAAAGAASWATEDAGAAAKETEQRRCADDCREMLEMPDLKGESK